MFGRKKTYYHVDEVPSKRTRGLRKPVSLVIAALMFLGGGYLFVLLHSPDVLVSPAAAAGYTEDNLVNSDENFIKIERINLLVPFHTGKTEKTLESGAWHRFPERGDPEQGGNFILSAHRFRLGATPNQTMERSPFYHLDKLQNEDIVDVYFNGNWYKYQIKKIFSVKPDAVEIEEPSDEAKLTLYSCSLKGSADGRVVIEAAPIHSSATSSESENPLL